VDLSVSFLYGIARDIWKAIQGRRRVLSPTAVIGLREKWQPLIASKIRERRANRLRRDVIIRDVKRVDNYPDSARPEKGISSWFRAGLVGTYHRGIQVGLQYEGLCWDESAKKWRYADYTKHEESDITAALLGLIRYENIESINWEGDEYYSFPHIYCHFVESKNQPYERLAFFERNEENDREYFTEIADYNSVEKFSKKLRVGHYAKSGSRLSGKNRAMESKND
jgi:hypothetical protein